eukprot:scaffold926_cov248-Pinguiococcus_pyrenoidosus.AAC.25
MRCRLLQTIDRISKLSELQGLHFHRCRLLHTVDCGPIEPIVGNSRDDEFFADEQLYTEARDIDRELARLISLGTSRLRWIGLDFTDQVGASLQHQVSLVFHLAYGVLGSNASAAQVVPVVLRETWMAIASCAALEVLLVDGSFDHIRQVANVSCHVHPSSDAAHVKLGPSDAAARAGADVVCL